MRFLSKVSHPRSGGNKYPSQLSGGQQFWQSCALCMKPQIMLFDELTSALDPEMVKVHTMVGLAAEGMTMIYVTHEMGFAREVADRVFMDMGTIVEQDPPDTFLSVPKSDRDREFLKQIIHRTPALATVPVSANHARVYRDGRSTNRTH